MADALWVDRRHPEYDEEKKKREYARDHYTGAVQEHAIESARELAEFDLHYRSDPEKLTEQVSRFMRGVSNIRYLYPRVQGESGLAFFERARITKYPGHMATLVDSYVGGVFSVEQNAEREWGDILGTPDDPGTVMYNLWRDIDGTGLNWETCLYQDAGSMIVDGLVWYLADRRRPGDPLRVHTIDPDSVVQWREENGAVVEALLWEKSWRQDSLEFSEPEEIEYYVHYTTEGWIRYMIPPGKERRLVPVPGESGQWKMPIYTSPDKKQKRIPLGRVRLPVKRPLGYQMALDANQLYNLLSDARWLYRVLNHPRLAGDVEDAQFERTMQYMAAGANGLQGKWDYISPPHENAASAYSTYRDEAREYYIVNHQRANQAAIEKSATEILYNEAAGRTAFLSLFAGAIDELENEKLFIASQIQAPNRPDEWLGSTVKRPRDFKPIDVERIADQRSTRFAVYANVLPVDLALELSGHDKDTVEMYRNYLEEDRLPEEGMFANAGSNGTATPPEPGAGDGADMGGEGIGATLAGIATGLGGGA